MTDSSAWSALAGALGGILLTGGFTLATTVLNHRWSAKADERVRREQETRDATERLRGVFHDYLVATNAYYHAIHQMHELGKSRGDDFDVWARKEYQALQEEYQYLTISAGNEVRRLARAYDMVLYALRDAAVAFDEDAWEKYRLETHKSREEVRVAMRAELGVYDLFGIEVRNWIGSFPSLQPSPQTVSQRDPAVSRRARPATRASGLPQPSFPVFG